MFDILLEIAENYINISHDMRLQKSFLASLEVNHQWRGEQPGDEFDKKMVAIAEIYNAWSLCAKVVISFFHNTNFRFLCVIVHSGCTLVNYHAIEISSSYEIWARSLVTWISKNTSNSKFTLGCQMAAILNVKNSVKISTSNYKLLALLKLVKLL